MKSWLGKFALAFGTISVLHAAPPAVTLVDPADAADWQMWTTSAGWKMIVPVVPANAAIDARVQAIDAAVKQAVKAGSVDPSRIYLAGRGEAAAAVFYTISRVPDLWAGAVALGGSPQAAIDTDHVYAANFANVPVLWITDHAQDELLARKLKDAGMNLEWRTAEKFAVSALFDALGRQVRPEYPSSVDCETNSPTFASCYWIHATKFDAAERNEVLPSSHIEPPIGPSLDLGGFGYKADDPGPGVEVSFLPQKYSGPLKMGDRITALDGRPVADAHQFREMLSAAKQERAATVMLQRGKDHIRLETAILMPKRKAAVTARVQGEFDASQKEIRIVSRTITEMDVTIPAAWAPAVLYWNGVPVERVEGPGCRLLRMEKQLESASACP